MDCVDRVLDVEYGDGEHFSKSERRQDSEQ